MAANKLQYSNLIFNSIKNEEYSTAIFLLKDILINEEKVQLLDITGTNRVIDDEYIKDLEDILYKKPSLLSFENSLSSIETLTKEEKEYSINYIRSNIYTDDRDKEKQGELIKLMSDSNAHNNLKSKISKLEKDLRL